MNNVLDAELKKLIEMYTQLPYDARIIIFSNANTLLAREKMYKQDESTV